MLDVFFTVDVEVWCDGWSDLDARFPEAFRRYVYGPTPRGEFGLRYQCEVLRDHGLTGVFFIEPLFSGRFGAQPLAEIVGIVAERAQEVQLHLHTEWVDEWPEPPVPGVRGKRQFLHDWDAGEQQQLLAEGLRRLAAAGGGQARCFRAGSFGFDTRTLDALASLGVPFDASYNATAFGPGSGVGGGVALHDLHLERGVAEWPMTVYDTGAGRLRHAQIGACSSQEIEHLLWAALRQGRRSVVLLFHNFELLTPSKTREDPVVVRRFRRLCRFFERHRDTFRVRGFADLPVPAAAPPQPPPLRSSLLRTGVRVAEQTWRRAYA
ncbi:MAG: hypothetical protein JNJ89_13630 [Rubrivivax sp.]|nr:hypothetical protein [Rubrivivax sp.]